MSYKTLEVELENGRVHPSGSEALPDRATALLTILSSAGADAAGPTNGSVAQQPGVARTCAELADRMEHWPKLPPEEASDFADDLEKAHLDLPPLKSAWD